MDETIMEKRAAADPSSHLEHMTEDELLLSKTGGKFRTTQKSQPFSETATERRAAADPTSDPKDETEGELLKRLPKVGGIFQATQMNQPSQHIRIVLLGKTGIGKSSLARTILRENVFGIHNTANPGTSECQKVTRQVGDGNITVIDTPGFFDNRNSDNALKSEITDTIIDGSEGIDAFLILFKVDRFTKQENKVVSKIKKYFSEEAFKHAVVVFTHGDQLDDNMKIEEFVSDNQYLCDLLEKCGNRCCVVDNKYWNDNQQDEYRNNQVQVAKLLQTVKEKVNSGGRYTNEMLQTVNKMIKQLVQRIYRSGVDMSNEEIMNQAKSIVSDILKKLAGVSTGVLLGALLGVPRMIARVILQVRKNKAEDVYEVPLKAATIQAFGVAALAGAVVGGCIGYEEADKADSVKKAVKNTAETLIKPMKDVWEGKHHTCDREKMK